MLAKSTPPPAVGPAERLAAIWRPLPASIMVADDSVVYRSSICRAIRTDWRLALVAFAGDGEVALAMISAIRPDIALLDIEMPLLSGYEVSAAVRARGPELGTQIVLMSAQIDDLTRRRAHDAGAVACLDKATPRGSICDLLTRISGQERIDTASPAAAPQLLPIPGLTT